MDPTEIPGRESTIAQRLRWARIMSGPTSDRDAAIKHRWPISTYRKHESGERGAQGLKKMYIKKYAKAFGVDEVWLDTGSGSPQPTPKATELSDEEARVIEALRAAKRA